MVGSRQSEFDSRSSNRIAGWHIHSNNLGREAKPDHV